MVLVALLVLPFLLKNYRVFQLNLVMVYAVAVLGLNILTGFNGQFSLGHGAFYAFGAYTAAILMDHFGVPYWATLPAAFVVCFVLRLRCRLSRAAAGRATTWRWPPSRWRWRCRSCSSTRASSTGPAACRASC